MLKNKNEVVFPMNKNDIIELEITDVTAEGSGVGRHDGMAVFVPAAAAGDVISCRIVKVCKSYCFGIIDKIIKPSADRAESGCEISKKCGGCVFRHIDYSAELRIKDKSVRDAFKRIGGLDIPFEDILGCESADRYRNKAQYPVSGEAGNAYCGFYAQRSHRVIPCGDCILQPEIFGKITEDVLGYINSRKIPPYNEESGKGCVRHIYLRRGYHSSEIMVCLVVTKEDRKLFAPMADMLMKKYPDIKSVVLNINSRRTNVIMGEKCVTVGGRAYIEDIMCGRRIKISPLAFYQVNTAQAERLYGIAADFAELKGGEVLLDLYCGAGTVGLSMADKISKLIGGEIIPEAVENAKENAAANGIENAEFICGDAGKIADSLAAKGMHPDVIVIDPPRKGCDSLTLDSIVKMSPEKVVMISCNPATAARDAAYLGERGYAAVKARAADMFPRTGHVECVALLSKLKSDQQSRWS